MRPLPKKLSTPNLIDPRECLPLDHQDRMPIEKSSFTRELNDDASSITSNQKDRYVDFGFIPKDSLFQRMNYFPINAGESPSDRTRILR